VVFQTNPSKQEQQMEALKSKDGKDNARLFLLAPENSLWRRQLFNHLLGERHRLISGSQCRK
jgi:hypothetical protein